MTLVFGQSTAEFNQQATGQDSSTFTSNINRLVLYFVYIFAARFVLGYLGTLCICIAAARTTCALREDFLDKLLRQDVAHFDKGGSGSAATQVTTSENPNPKAMIMLLTTWPRWQQNQSRHSGKAVHLRPRHLTLFLRFHRSACSSMEAGSHRNEHNTCYLLDHRGMYWLRRAYRS
jgi:hypothetical protein